MSDEELKNAGGGYWYHYNCSLCGYHLDTQSPVKACPWCGRGWMY